MQVLIGGTTSFAIQRGTTKTYPVQFLNDDGSTIDILTGTVKAMVDCTSVSQTNPYTFLVTPHGTRGAWGQGSFTVPSSFTGLLAGTYSVQGRIDDGSGGSGQIASVAVLTGGTGFRAKPTLALSDTTGGTGSTLTATMVATTLQSATVTALGTGWTGFAQVALSGGGGVGGSFLAAVSGPVASITLTNPGYGFFSNPTVSISGSGGSNATGVAIVDATSLRRIYVTNGGSGYVTAPAVVITGTNTVLATATSTIVGGVVTEINLTLAGLGYTAAPVISFTGGGGGVGAAATAETGPGSLSGAAPVISVSGSGYAVAPRLVASAPSSGVGRPARATCTVLAGVLNSTAITDCGFGYTGPVTWTVVPQPGDPGINGLITSQTPLTGYVSQLYLVNPGDRYPVNLPGLTQTSVTLTGGGGSAAAASVVVTGTVTNLTLGNGGFGYTDAPTLAITPVSGFAGSGATALANLSAVLASVGTTAGSGYWGFPQVVISGVTPATTPTFTVTVTRGVTQLSGTLLTLVVT